MNNRINGLLGMARRAGKVCSGEAQIEAMLKKRKGCLMILAEDSPGTQKNFTRWAEDIGLPVMIYGSKQELGLLLGLSPRSAILVMDGGFAKAILEARS